MSSLTIDGASQANSNIAIASNTLQTALNNIASGTQQATGDIADISVASGLKSITGALQTVATSLNEALSLTQVASGGIGQIQSIVGQLTSLASEAQSPTLNADNRKQLNQQFQQLSSTIDTIATTTSFNGQNVLDGSLSGANALSLNAFLGQPSGSNDNTLSISNLSTSSLFNAQDLNILSPDSASQASAVLGDALNQALNAQSGVSAYQGTLGYALGGVDTALQNQQAALSSISDTNVATASTDASLANIQDNAAIALAAQGNNLPAALLQLIG